METFPASFFQPRGIVLVGASHDAAKLGYGVARNLTACGCAGAHFEPNVGAAFLQMEMTDELG